MMRQRPFCTICALILQILLVLCCASGKPARIAIVTISTGAVATPYVAHTAVNKALYANHNGYRLLLHPHLDPSRPPSWSKILALKMAILSREYDWLVWLDGDMVITNFGARIERMLPRGQPSIDLLVSRDCDSLNMGAFILRASASALETLEEIYGGRHVTAKILKDSWWEQKSVIALYAKSERLRNKTLIVPQRTFNAYPPGYQCYEEGTAGWSEGDFAVHFPGTDEGLRNRLVQDYLNKVAFE